MNADTTQSPMEHFHARAGGKCMIAGEYSALLPGRWALAAAATGGVKATACRSPGWCVERTEGNLSWRPGSPVGEAFLFAASAVNAMDSYGFRPCTVVTTAAPEGTPPGSKIGLGTSASAVVAIIAACASAQDRPPSELVGVVRQLALEAHAAAQKGRGSGYDIATIVAGGVVAWNADAGISRRLAWPESLQVALVHTGSSASTTGHIRAWEERIPPTERADAMGALCSTTDAAIAAFESGTVLDIVAAITATQNALMEFDRVWNLGIVPPPLQRLCDEVQAAGCAPRISGAGGGDSILVFSESATSLQGALSACEALGARHIQTVIPGPGVALEGPQ